MLEKLPGKEQHVHNHSRGSTPPPYSTLITLNESYAETEANNIYIALLSSLISVQTTYSSLNRTKTHSSNLRKALESLQPSALQPD